MSSTGPNRLRHVCRPVRLFYWREWSHTLCARPEGFPEAFQVYHFRDDTPGALSGWRWRYSSGGCWAASGLCFPTALKAMRAALSSGAQVER